ncbi:MAG TPA: beta-propeller fold lactonase family protein [Polyangiaceae bacterium]|jgi:YVTN family beta-propeller protein
MPLGRTLVLAAAPVLLLAAVACSRSKPAPALLYVSDEAGGAVVGIDPANGAIVTRIPVGKRPRGLHVSRDGKKLYVALSGSPRGGPGVDESKLPPADRSADGIGVVDLVARKLLNTFPSGQDPEAFDLSPDGQTLYVSNEETAEMSVLDVVSGTVRKRVPVGREPEGVTVRPDGKVVFVTSELDDEVTAIDTGSLAVLGQIHTGKRPRSVVFARDGRTAFVPDEMGARITVIDGVALQPLGDIDIHLDSPMPSGPRPMGGALSPDGKTVYVSTGRGGSIAVIDVASRKQVRSLDGVGDRPWGIAVSPDGARLYSANGTSGDVSFVNLATGNVDRRVATGGLPWGAVLAP